MARRYVVLACTAWLLCSAAQGQSLASAPAPRRPAAAAPAPARLDLTAPAPSRVVPPAQLRELLATPDSDAAVTDVSVQGARYVGPVPVGQVQAIYWAFLHPTQAWRIFTPVVQP